MSCEAVQERLSELALARALDDEARWEARDRAHVADCAECTAHARFLRRLAAELDALPAPAPDAALLARVRARSERALRARSRPPALGAGFGLELAGALALALLALPFVAGHAWLVVQAAGAWLAPWLPGPVLTWLGVVYFGSLALVLGAGYGSIPAAVHYARRLREAS